MSEPDFVTPIGLGGEPCDEIDWRLADDIHRELTERLDAIDRARAEAMAHAHEYVIWR